MKKKKKVAILLFPISKIGGIWTVHVELKKAYEKLGYDVEDYFLTMNKKVLNSPKNQHTGEHFCGNDTLGAYSDEHIDLTLKELNKYDVLVFTHPCPSETAFKEMDKWKRIYREARGKKVVVWHDPFWTKYYPWIEEEMKHIDVIACIQSKAYNSLTKKMQKKAFICNHPLSLEDMGDYTNKKKDMLMSPHQFKTWKHIDKLVEVVPELITKIPKLKINIYNKGIEYYKMSGVKRSDRYYRNGKWIWDEAIAAGMKYKGNVTDETLIKDFKKHKICVDLSVGELGSIKGKQGEDYRSVNYSLIESMKYGGLQVVRFNSILEPIFNEDNFLVVDDDNLLESLVENIQRGYKDFDTKKMKKMREKNREVLAENYDSIKVVKSIMKSV